MSEIPKRLQDEFIGWMDAGNDVAEEMPDGAWFSILENFATDFCKKHKLKLDENDMVHWWLNNRS